MVSAISLCLFALGLSAVSSQLLSGEEELPEAPTFDRRSFKHGKPIKVVPLGKKHKKFGGFLPHVFGKTPYVEIPVVHEGPKPFYKIHRYHGIEVKPSSDVSFSTPEPIIETHSIEPPSGDFVPDFGHDHDHPFPPPSPAVVLPEYKPIFTQPPPVHAALPPSPAKPIFSYVPPPQPVFSAVPISPVFTAVPIFRPAPIPVPAPVFNHVPPAQPIFPVKLPAPVYQTPSPAPVLQPIPIKIPAPVLPPLPAPSPAPVLVKIPVVPAVSVPVPSPAPVLPSLPVVSPTPTPSFHISLPPAQLPVPSPSLPTFSALPSVPVPTPEPEFPYPPSGTPIAPFVKDISLGNVDIPSSPLPTLETPRLEEVTPTIVDDGSKTHDHVFGPVKTDSGLFQKFKGWKADKASAALGHLAQFKPSIGFSHPPSKIPLEIPAYQNLQLPGTAHSLPLAPAPIFFPPAPFVPPAKYESFPPNNIESPPLFNSYGAPIPHDSYSRIPHDRLSSAASEEEPAVVPAPADNKQQIQQQQQSQRFQPQAAPREHPVYIAEEDKTKEENKTAEDVHPEPDDYKTEKEPTAEDVASNYPNHKE